VTPSLASVGATQAALTPATTGILGTGITAGQAAQAATLIGGVASGATSGVQAEQQKEAAEKDSKAKADASRTAAAAELEEAGEAAAQQRFDIARETLRQRGVGQNSGLSERSVAALARNSEFQAGLDSTTVEKNLESKRKAAAAKGRGIQITRSSEKNSIGSPSRLRIAASTVGAGLKSARAGLQIKREIEGS